MTQPIFIIKKITVIEVIKKINESKYYRGLDWGESEPLTLIKEIDNLNDDSGFIDLAKVANKLNSFQTYKMIGGANSAIDLTIKNINDSKIRKIENLESESGKTMNDSCLNIDEDTIWGMPHDPSVDEKEERSLIKRVKPRT